MATRVFDSMQLTIRRQVADVDTTPGALGTTHAPNLILYAYANPVLSDSGRHQAGQLCSGPAQGLERGHQAGASLLLA